MIKALPGRLLIIPLTFLCTILLLSRPQAGMAQVATLDGDILTLHELEVGQLYYAVELQIVPASDPLAFTVVDFTELNGSTFAEPNRLNHGLLEIPALPVGDLSYWVNLEVQSEPVLQLTLVDFGLNESDVGACARPVPDSSHGVDNPDIVDGFSVSTEFLFDGGPGPDGIPPVDTPIFGLQSRTTLAPDDLVVGVRIGEDVRAYPHYILDWHEIVNDQYLIDGEAVDLTLSYCPLTGSAMMWKGQIDAQDSTFGTSGLLLNSNLILYDRETGSLWSQMLEQAINGPRLLSIPERVQVIETTWKTWQSMYPETMLLTDFTGYSRPYESYPYGTFRTNPSLRFPVENSDDRRLHRKERVLGINVGDASRVYPIGNFDPGVTVLNEVVGDMDVVVVGSGDRNFGAVYNRQLEDCSRLDFLPVENQLPIVMTDNEGNLWDLFGNAVSGPREGQSLQKTNSYIAYWYAWTAFFPGATIFE